MPNMEIESVPLGHIYALALINQAAKQNVLPDVTEDVRSLPTLLEQNPALLQFAEAATISPEEKAAVIERIFHGRAHPLTVNVLKAMALRDRLMFIKGFIQAFEEILKVRAGEIDVELTSSAELPADVLQRITAAVGKSLGKTPEMKTKVNPALIGGMTIRVGDTFFDGSVQTQLEKMKQRMERKSIFNLQQNMEQIIV